MGTLPCLLDAAIFADIDEDPWTAENMLFGI